MVRDDWVEERPGLGTRKEAAIVHAGHLDGGASACATRGGPAATNETAAHWAVDGPAVRWRGPHSDTPTATLYLFAEACRADHTDRIPMLTHQLVGVCERERARVRRRRSSGATFERARAREIRGQTVGRPVRRRQPRTAKGELLRRGVRHCRRPLVTGQVARVGKLVVVEHERGERLLAVQPVKLPLL